MDTPQGVLYIRIIQRREGLQPATLPAAECNRGGANSPPAGDGAYIDTFWIKPAARSLDEMTRYFQMIRGKIPADGEFHQDDPGGKGGG